MGLRRRGAAHALTPMTPDDPPEAAVLQAVRCLYDGVAEHYEEDRARWLQVAGGPAEAAMREDLAAVLRPGARVLDAGCGTGALAREILGLEPAVDLTLLEPRPRCSPRAVTSG